MTRMALQNLRSWLAEWSSAKKKLADCQSKMSKKNVKSGAPLDVSRTLLQQCQSNTTEFNQSTTQSKADLQRQTKQHNDILLTANKKHRCALTEEDLDARLLARVLAQTENMSRHGNPYLAASSTEVTRSKTKRYADGRSPHGACVPPTHLAGGSPIRAGPRSPPRVACTSWHDTAQHGERRIPLVRSNIPLAEAIAIETEQRRQYWNRFAGSHATEADAATERRTETEAGPDEASVSTIDEDYETLPSSPRWDDVAYSNLDFQPDLPFAVEKQCCFRVSPSCARPVPIYMSGSTCAPIHVTSLLS